MMIAIHVDTRSAGCASALPHTTSRLLRSMICDLYHVIYPWNLCDDLSLTYMIKQMYLQHRRCSQPRQLHLMDMLQVMYRDIYPYGKPPTPYMSCVMFMVQALHKIQHLQLNVQYNK